MTKPPILFLHSLEPLVEVSEINSRIPVRLAKVMQELPVITPQEEEEIYSVVSARSSQKTSRAVRLKLMLLLVC
jgi:hypothetical protein